MKQFDVTLAKDPRAADGPIAEPFGLSDLMSAARRQYLPLMLATGIGLALGVVHYVTTPKEYYAAAQILVEDRLNDFDQQIAQNVPSLRNDTALLNEMQILKSLEIAEEVARQTDLANNEVFLDPPESLARRLVGIAAGAVRAALPFAASEPPAAADASLTPEERAERQIETLAAKLRGDVKIERIGTSFAVEISYVSHDPQLAAQIANAYADAYMTDHLAANEQATQRTAEWMQTRLEDLQTSANAAARAAETFKAENGLSDLDGQLVSEQTLAQLNLELAAAEAETARASALAGQYQAVLDGGEEAVLETTQAGGPNLGDDPALNLLQQRLAEVSSRLATVKADFGRDHPQVALLEAEQAEIINRARNEFSRLSQKAQSDFESAAAGEKALQARVANAEQQNSADNAAQVRLRELMQQAATLNTLYQTMSERSEQMAMRGSFPVSSGRILSAALVPRAAALPKAVLVLAVGALLGLLVGFSIAVLRESRERFFRTGEDVVRHTGLPFMGYLPELDSAAGPRNRRGTDNSDDWTPEKAAPQFFVPLYQPQSMFSETLRNIHLTAEMRLRGMSGRVIGVTSMLPGEGKTTLAANLANLLANSGIETLLMDADLRNPGLTRALQPMQPRGLVEVLQGQCEPDDALIAVRSTGLHILPCFQRGGLNYAGEILHQPVMGALVSQARQDFGYVVIDLPPVGAVVDAKAVLPVLDGLIVAAQWGKTPRALARQFMAREPELAQKVLGMVLTRTDTSALAKYGVPGGFESYLDTYAEAYY